MSQNLKKIAIGCFFAEPKDDAKATEEAFSLIREGAELLLAVDRGGMDDTEHQKSMDALKAVCESVDVPVIGTGEIRRMEDVKMLLYAGCDRVALPEEAV
ncbi:MAG: tRNA-dihydrouridine synthase, partial [Lachnospiraceae bacterium]|nr:tRNA-dihydrouridine synthase [Lachnospiraceae bacterium]